jgi:hypothetical protein
MRRPVGRRRCMDGPQRPAYDAVMAEGDGLDVR